MARRLKLQKYELTHVNYYWLGAFRLRVEVSDPDGSGADPNVFLYLRDQPSPHDGSVEDHWCGIAGPVDLADYPVGAPNEQTTYPFFRLSYIEVDLRATAQAAEIWTLIQAEVNQLLLALDRLERLVATEEVYVGAAAPEEAGSSSSASVSESA